MNSGSLKFSLREVAFFVREVPRLWFYYTLPYWYAYAVGNSVGHYNTHTAFLIPPIKISISFYLLT